MTDLHHSRPQQPISTHLTITGQSIPQIILATGPRGTEQFVNFFTANIRNPNTREAYLRAWSRFDRWCQQKRNIKSIGQIRPLVVAEYIEGLQQKYSAPTVKQHLAAIRKCFDYLQVHQIVPENPAAPVRGPKYSVNTGKTPILDDQQVLALFDSIPKDSLIGLRDRAILGVMVYTWSRVGALVSVRVKDYYSQGKRWRLRLGEKGGKDHIVPTHHLADEYLDAYIHAAAIGDDRVGYLFRTFDRKRRLTERPMSRRDVLAMIKRRAKKAGIPWQTCCHSFRATGITNYISHGGRIDVAQDMAGHADPRTTRIYDRSGEKVTLEEIERIRFERMPE